MRLTIRLPAWWERCGNCRFQRLGAWLVGWAPQKLVNGNAGHGVLLVLRSRNAASCSHCVCETPRPVRIAFAKHGVLLAMRSRNVTSCKLAALILFDRGYAHRVVSNFVKYVVNCDALSVRV